MGSFYTEVSTQIPSMIAHKPWRVANGLCAFLLSESSNQMATTGGIQIKKQLGLSAIRADMAIGEEYESGVADQYYNPNSTLVQAQVNAHGEC